MYEEAEFSGSECSSQGPSSSNGSTSDFSDSIKSLHEQFEQTVIASEVLSLPKGLCENRTLFEEFFSLETWNSLPDPVQKHLCSFLPMFTDNIALERNNTIEALFRNQITRFGLCPLAKLQKRIEEGNCRPEILMLKKSVAKAERRERRFQECEQLEQLANKLIASRECLLQKKIHNLQQAKTHARSNLRCSSRRSVVNLNRAKRRYFQEIASISEQLGIPSSLSDDENYVDVQNHPSRKQRRICNATQAGSPNSEADARIMNTMDWKGIANYVIGPNGKIIISDRHYYNILVQHKRRKIEEPAHPELYCQEQKLKDIVFRTQASSGYRRIMPLMKINSSNGLPLYEKSKSKYLSKTQLNSEGSMITNSVELVKRTTHSSTDLSSLDDSLMLENGCESSQLGGEQESYINNYFSSYDDVDKTIREDCILPIKYENEKSGVNIAVGLEPKTMDDSESKENFLEQNLSISENTTFSPTDKIKQVEKRETNFLAEERNYDRCEELDMLELKDESIDRSTEISLNVSKNKTLPPSSQETYNISMSELMQETHNCFLSLVRDMFCSTPDHRLTIEELKIKLNMWLKTPISALNDWYNQAEDKWDNMLYSAILFLSGEFSDQPDDFVPYIEYKIQLNIYQWIGASRDSDHRLLDLCQYWLGRKDDMGMKSLSRPPKISSKQKNMTVYNMSCFDDDDRSSERTISPPPPRYPTDWSVRKATDEEIRAFREQEKHRYENPHMAFTYKQHSYDSVVGPVKGIYTQVPGISKARGHNMLVADRPNFVTILTLVRDATARLPNGEGTRADICELLKSSQYISQTATDQVLQTIVSGALDRMHTEHDPCVKYDTKRKIWIYLHRNRSKEEFERLHQQYQGISKHKKPVCRKSKSKEIGTSNRTSPAANIKSTSLESESVHSDSNTECSNSTLFKHDIAESISPNAILPDLSNINNNASTNRNETSQSLGRLLDAERGTSAVSDEIPEDCFKISACVASLRKPMADNSSGKISSVNFANTQPRINDRTKNHTNTQGVIDIESQSMQSTLKKNNLAITTKPATISTPSSVSNIENLISVSPLQISTSTGRGDMDRMIHNFIMPVAINVEKSPQAKPLDTMHPSASKNAPVINAQQTTIYTVNKSLLQTKGIVPLSSQSANDRCLIKTETFLSKLGNHQKVTEGENRNSPATKIAGSVIAKPDIGMNTTDMTNTITLHKGQQSALTPAQQKQILQNLLAQQHKPIQFPKSIVTEQQGNSISVASSCSSISKMQKQPALTLAATTTMTRTNAKPQSVRPGINVPHMVQIKSSNTILGAPSITKVHSRTASDELKSLQKNTSLVNKSTNLFMKSDISEDTASEKNSKINLIAEPMKSTAVFIQTSMANNTVTRMLKSVPSVIHPANNIIRTTINSTSMNHVPVNSKVIKKIPENQMISLENLVTRDQIADATLQVAEPKATKTQLVHLSGSCPSVSSVAQYQVVSTNRNIVTVAQSPTERTTQTIITTTANNIVDTEHILNADHSSIFSGNNIQIKTSTRQHGHSSSKNTMQANAIQAQQNQLQQTVQHQQQPRIQQAFSKLTATPIELPTNGKKATSFINSSPINVATFGGGPLIIANKSVVHSDPKQQGSTNIAIQDAVATNIPNIVYGRTIVKEQGNSASQDHVAIPIGQPISSSPARKLILGNQFVKVRTISKQQDQITFTQDSRCDTDISHPVSNVTVSVSNDMLKGINKTTNETRMESSLKPAVCKSSNVATALKTASRVGIRLNQNMQRVVIAAHRGQLVTQQILVPQSFQGGALNIKRLKVIPFNNPQNKGTTTPLQTSIVQDKPASTNTVGNINHSVNERNELNIDSNTK
ncbi:uncharacterized protein LOC129771214 isoform X2 [Toxorhynchites rutilus septentrionalis]|uniref:uncharacterized protein LOC129771214 isoform X2 n=1 Tax=Toxorhynchites rutilus septentrionalis TaxID=329112 RepID=UPI002478CBF2|nr:uncharacterized protein LOC129771214 isoform X2 [Toxorhynchites rutilus septentrionalis]